ncbi:MAG: hypothetical protein AAGD11_07825 [Planctomycetota bacterium]
MRVIDANGRHSWAVADWQQLTSTAIARPTIIYVHGNRVSSGHDRAEGLQVYRSFLTHRPVKGPIRFIIWSWPAEQIPGPIKDYLVKAQRTNPVAWQLAWMLDKLPAEAPIGMVGYSYGTRVVCGAAHLLAGGKIGPLELASRAKKAQPPTRAALMAAAFDADWLQPGRFYSRSLVQLDRVMLATNQFDPAMRFYHLSNGRGRMDALGKFGLKDPRSLGGMLRRVQRIDYTRSVGRSHVIDDYLAAERQMRSLWHGLMVETPKSMASAGSGAIATSRK